MTAKPIFKSGIYYDLPDKEYRAAEGVSQSELKVLDRSGQHYLAKIDPEEEKEDSDSLLLGKVTSTLTLEPDAAPWWALKPEGMKFTTIEGKAWQKEAEKTGKQIVPFEMFQKASRMATILNEDPEIGPLLLGSKREVSIFSEVETEHGSVTVKCRPDIVTPGNVLLDLKTTRDARPKPFAGYMKNYGYPLQGAFYLDRWNEQCPPGERKDHFMLIAIESYAPFEFMLYQMDSGDLAIARNAYMNLLTQYAACKKLNKWDGYPRGIHQIKVY